MRWPWTATKLLFGIIALAHTHREFVNLAMTTTYMGRKVQTQHVFEAVRNKETICSAWTRLCCLYGDKWLPTEQTFVIWEVFPYAAISANNNVSVYCLHSRPRSFYPLRIRINRYASAVIVCRNTAINRKATIMPKRQRLAYYRHESAARWPFPTSFDVCHSSHANSVLNVAMSRMKIV